MAKHQSNINSFEEPLDETLKTSLRGDLRDKEVLMDLIDKILKVHDSERPPKLKQVMILPKHHLLKTKGNLQHLKTRATLDSFKQSMNLDKMVHELVHLNRALKSIDVNLEKKQEQVFDYLSYNPVTELPNYVLLQHYIEKAIDKKKEFSILSFDFNNFGLYNFSFGHKFGDLILQAISERIRGMFEDQAIVTHPNADEFFVVCEKLPSAQHLHNIQNLLSLPFYINSQLVYLVANCGLYTVHPQDQAADVLKNSSTALKMAKKSANHQYVLQQKDRYYLNFNSHFINDLRKGFLKEELFVVFQPKIDVRTMRVCGAETLIRWKHAQKGMISPLEFIPFAEKTGLISKITDFVLFKIEECIEQISQHTTSSFSLSFNVSSVEINSIEFKKRIEHLVLNQFENIIFEAEVTESIFLDSFDDSVKSLKYFRDLGLSLSIDDFGTGFSSLSYLASLPIDYIKIDQSFVKKALDDEKRLIIVQLIIDMAKRLGVGLVAEGIENQEQSELLYNLGCSIHQGYLYSKPVPLVELLPMLK